MKGKVLCKIGAVALVVLLTLLFPAGASAQGGQVATLVQNCAVWTQQPSGVGPTPIISGLILRKGEMVTVWQAVGTNLQITTSRNQTGWIPGKCVGWVPTQPTATPQPAAPPSTVPSQGGIVPLPQGSTANAAVGSQQGIGVIGVLDESCCLRPTTTGGSRAKCLVRLAKGAQVTITGYAGEGTCDQGTCSWVDATSSTGKSGKLHLSCIEGWQTVATQLGGQVAGGTQQTYTASDYGQSGDTQAYGQGYADYEEEEPGGFLTESGYADFVEPESFPPARERWDIGNNVSLVNWSEEPWLGFDPEKDWNSAAIRSFLQGDKTRLEIGFVDGGAFAGTILSRETMVGVLGSENLVKGFERAIGLRLEPGVHRIYFSTDPEKGPDIPEEVRGLVHLDSMLQFGEYLAHELQHINRVRQGKSLEMLRTFAQYGSSGITKLPSNAKAQLKQQVHQDEVETWQEALAEPAKVAALIPGILNREFPGQAQDSGYGGNQYGTSPCVGPECPHEPSYGDFGQPGSSATTASSANLTGFQHVGANVYVKPTLLPLDLSCFSGQGFRQVAGMEVPIAISFIRTTPPPPPPSARIVPRTELWSKVPTEAQREILGMGLQPIPGFDQIVVFDNFTGALTQLEANLAHELVHLYRVEQGNFQFNEEEDTGEALRRLDRGARLFSCQTPRSSSTAQPR